MLTYKKNIEECNYCSYQKLADANFTLAGMKTECVQEQSEMEKKGFKMSSTQDFYFLYTPFFCSHVQPLTNK